MTLEYIELVKDIFRYLALNSSSKELDPNTHKVNEAIANGDDENINLFDVTPSYKQFVQYISNSTASGDDFAISKSKMGNHWLPFYMSCNPCYEGKNRLKRFI